MKGSLSEKTDQSVIFWDFDGTLVYSNTSFLDSLEKALSETGCRISEQLCREFLKSACSWNHPENSYPGETGENWWRSLLQKTDRFLSQMELPSDQRGKICGSFRENAVHFPYIPYEDAEEILAYTRERGYRNYILSNNFPELRITAEKMGLSSFLDGCFLSSEIGYEKPRIELFQYALSHVPEPGAVYMVGDHPTADMEGAAAAGFHTILVHRECSAPAAEYVCRNLAEIQNIL